MGSVDALIGAGGVLAGVGITYLGTSRDRNQRVRDASEERDFANRRDACLMLERQRARQLENAEALVKHYREGKVVDSNEDRSDIQNPEVDAMVSLFLPDSVEHITEEVNGLWSAFLSSCGAIERANLGQERIDAVKGMNAVFERLRSSSNKLRKALREEAHSK